MTARQMNQKTAVSVDSVPAMFMSVTDTLLASAGPFLAALIGKLGVNLEGLPEGTGGSVTPSHAEFGEGVGRPPDPAMSVAAHRSPGSARHRLATLVTRLPTISAAMRALQVSRQDY
jgi:hypothetical protein